MNQSQIDAQETLDQFRELAEQKLKEIEKGLQLIPRRANGNWARVGDMAEVASKLSELSDFLNHTGEYSQID